MRTRRLRLLLAASMLGLLLSLLLVPALAGAAPASTPPPPPPTLTGETLAGNSFNATNTFACSGNLGGTFSFAATGTAVGPYSGPYTETGSAKIAANGTLTAFTATFTIDSPLGQVTGTKTLTSGTGACLVGAIVFAVAQTTYQATIHTSHGNYADQGTSATNVNIGSPITQTTNLNETFASSQTHTTLIVPTSADQCKEGGWQTFGGLFKNQGDCVSFVATGGKNPPAGA